MPLNLESVRTITDTEAKEFQTHWDWEPHKPGEDAKSFPYSLGYRRWGFNTYKYIDVSDSAIDAWERENFTTLVQMPKAHRAPCQEKQHLDSLPFLSMQKAIKLWEFLSGEPYTAIKPIMFYLRPAGMSGFLHSSSRYPQGGFAVANYSVTTELAPAVARAFNRLKILRQDASSWLLKYPEHTITGLLPAVFDKTGEAQNNARTALRAFAENNHQPLLQETTRRYGQPEVIDMVNALLVLNPLDNHPTRTSALPTFCQPSLWTRPLLKTNAQPLPDNALSYLGEILRPPQEGALHPGLLQVKDACTTGSPVEFAWGLFIAWQTAGAPLKESWASTTLDALGNDDTTRKLTPSIRARPGESQHKRTIVGLGILAAIGSDIALMQPNDTAQKLKFKVSQERAKEKVTDIAEGRELTVVELENRLAPNFGLDGNGSLLLNLSLYQFTISSDETPKPLVRDAPGSHLEGLSKSNKSNNESQANDAVNRYKLLKKDVHTVVAQ